MAQNVHLFLKANGKEIKGDSTVSSLGRADSIECIDYQQGVTSAREGATGMVTGRRRYMPLEITKAIDKSSPLLMKALCNSEKIDATFKFYRPSPAGDGTTEQFYTVVLKDGNIASVKEISPNTLSQQDASLPPLEKVAFTFRTISWTYTSGGVTHQDTWSGES